MARAPTISVLVLGMEHYSALGVMRSLGRWGVPVYGVHPTPRAPAAASRYCRSVFAWNIDDAPAHASVAFLLKVAEQGGERPILLATNDETALFVAKNAAALESAFLFPKNSWHIMRALYNKREMHFLARAIGIPTPSCAFPQSRTEVVEFAKTARFPVILKATDNIAASHRAGGKITVITRSQDELLTRYDALEDLSEPVLMLQEYVAARPELNWTFNGYFDHDSNCLFWITGHKLHQEPPYTGLIALGVCRLNPTVRDMSLKLAKATGYKGIVDIGYLYDAREGTYKLHDVNPRLGASFRMFVGSDGMDVVRAAYLHLTGQPVSASTLCDGRKWIVEDSDIFASLKYLGDRTLTVRQWLTSYGGVREGAWFAVDDLRPFWGMCGRVCLRAYRQILSRLGWRKIPPPPRPGMLKT